MTRTDTKIILLVHLGHIHVLHSILCVGAGELPVVFTTLRGENLPEILFVLKIMVLVVGLFSDITVLCTGLL